MINYIIEMVSSPLQPPYQVSHMCCTSGSLLVCVVHHPHVSLSLLFCFGFHLKDVSLSTTDHLHCKHANTTHTAWRVIVKLINRKTSSALCTSVRRLLQIVKDMKEHLSRAWDDIVSFLNLPFGFHLIIPKVHTHIYPTFSLSIHSVHSSQPSTSLTQTSSMQKY